MFQTLLYIPAEVAGYPMFGFGVLLAVWAVASVGLLAWLAWRQGFNADTWGYVPILLLLGAVIAWVLPAIQEPRGLPIRGYGVMMLLAVAAGSWMATRRARRVGLDPDLIFSLIFWMIVPGIVGARAFYVIEYWPDYWQNFTRPGGGLGPLVGSIVNVAKGGLVVYGSFIGGVAGAILFIRKHRLPLLALCDLLAPAMLLGLAIGRVGCLLNGCCFGGLCDHAWAITFPAGNAPDFTPPYRAQVDRGQMYGFTLSANPKDLSRVWAVAPGTPAAKAGLKRDDVLKTINGFDVSTTGHAAAVLEEAFLDGVSLEIECEGHRMISIPAIVPPARSLAVHPAQIYSAAGALLLCLLLLFYERFQRRDGELFALMLSVYPVVRFAVESLRSDEAAVPGTGMSIAQNVSIVLLLCAACLWVYILRRPRGMALRK